MECIEAILVDFDGTLVKTELANAKAYAQALANSGYDIPVNLVLSSCIGRHWSKFLPDLLREKYNDVVGKKIAAEKKDIYPHFFSEISLNAPLLKLLKSLNADVPKALVTNASRDSVLAILDKFKLANFFNALICQEDVKNPKPDPECYLLAINLLKVNASNCIAIEDSDIGMISAHNAGIQTIKLA